MDAMALLSSKQACTFSHLFLSPSPRLATSSPRPCTNLPSLCHCLRSVQANVVSAMQVPMVVSPIPPQAQPRAVMLTTPPETSHRHGPIPDTTVRRKRVAARRATGRSIFYEEEDTYVLMEPDQEEVFVTAEELRARLRSWLENFPGKLPDDLAKFPDLDAAVTHLMGSACELEVGAGKGSVQWFEVRLES
eukprot:TRINITY_DN9792_c0_g1_i2.p1 TRINITY_DN9792_c0_g1~~TRINITY_DN9792_c0_g1_i2.p1  ORF type:complete len:191 (-),score=23.09 TRINITY_DN9792_c0_g1_i2:266-838(-)